MIPMRTSSIFKSRWMALVWATGIIWFALDVAGSSGGAGGKAAAQGQATDATGAPVTDQDLQEVANALGDD